ncbi:MAG TPA: NAD-dependent epimerase/dehydratase family protein [Gemmatimonadaceae bacterium]|nr:NAD-dependent epimerase/dehydratase family protein [Gemmatimonadaceae bacterium]
MADFDSSALIGYTGFVGGNLARQRSFDERFNSTNIDEIRDRNFDLIVCAGAPAEKWKANADPQADLANIDRLIRALDEVEADKFVLISTVDVFANPVGVDEDTPTSLTDLHAYGRNRRMLEEVIGSRFDALIVRLPGLYGPGLKKNVIYDFLHENETRKIDSRGVFQFYGLDRLWRDIETALDAELPLAHFATEPVSVAEVVHDAFGIEFSNEVMPNPARYDMRTRYAELFGGKTPYLESREQVLAGIRTFVQGS